MKHYHNKEDLTGEDVKYLVIEENKSYQFQFSKVDESMYGLAIISDVMNL